MFGLIYTFVAPKRVFVSKIIMLLFFTLRAKIISGVREVGTVIAVIVVICRQNFFIIFLEQLQVGSKIL